MASAGRHEPVTYLQANAAQKVSFVAALLRRAHQVPDWDPGDDLGAGIELLRRRHVAGSEGFREHLETGFPKAYFDAFLNAFPDPLAVALLTFEAHEEIVIGDRTAPLAE